MLLSSDERSLCKAKGPAARPPAADKSLSGVVTQGSCMVPLYLPPDSVSDFGTCRLAIAYVSVNRLSARPEVAPSLWRQGYCFQYHAILDDYTQDLVQGACRNLRASIQCSKLCLLHRSKQSTSKRTASLTLVSTPAIGVRVPSLSPKHTRWRNL